MKNHRDQIKIHLFNYSPPPHYSKTKQKKKDQERLDQRSLIYQRLRNKSAPGESVSPCSENGSAIIKICKIYLVLLSVSGSRIGRFNARYFSPRRDDVRNKADEWSMNAAGKDSFSRRWSILIG